MKYTIALISFLFLLGCSTEKESFLDSSLVTYPVDKDSLELVFTGADTIHLEDFVLGSYTDFRAIQQEGEHFLAGIHSSQHALDLLNLSTLSSEGQIAFEREGPNGILGSIDGFFYHNVDSIFVLSIDENTIHLMNMDGKKIDAFDFNQFALPDGFEDYDVYADQGLMNGPDYNAQEKTLQFYTYRWADAYRTQLFASYSIESRSFQSIYGSYPEHYQEDKNYLLYEDPGLLTVGNYSYVYFGTSPNIYTYDNRSGELLSVKAYHCEHWPGVPEGLPLNTDFQEEVDWLTEVAAYVFLLYDEQSELFYRLMKREQPVTNSSGLLNPRWFGPWCIDIFDKSLNPVGHTEIPANTVLPVMSFVSNGKLWMKNPSKEVKEEESLYYTLQIRSK